MMSMMKRNEKEEWEKKIGFNKERDELEKIFEEYENLKYYIDLVNFKEKKKGKLSFNEKKNDDCYIEYIFEKKNFLKI